MVNGRRYTPDENAWLIENYPRLGARAALADEFEQMFGYRRGVSAMVTQANKLGSRVVLIRDDPNEARAQRSIYWDREPEMEAWMLENDKGRRANAVADDFEQRFGFRPTSRQISRFRSTHGTQTKSGTLYKSRSSRMVPVGTERVSSSGYIFVKVRDYATVPGTKDNWKRKQNIVWERETGMTVPEGFQIVSADGDKTNCDISNLVCVSRSDMSNINRLGYAYSDRQTLEAAIALSKLTSRIIDAEAATPRTCEVCGKTFVPQSRSAYGNITCDECIESGHRARGNRCGGETATCAKCGREFTKYVGRQKLCRSCSTSKKAVAK